MINKYHSASHCKYLIQYHIIWCPKFRYNILKNGADQTLKDILSDICNEYEWTIKALEVMPDHIHIFIDADHISSPDRVVMRLKSISARKLFEIYPELRSRYWGGHLWSKGYFISSVGCISEDTVKQYIEDQKTKEGGKLICQKQKRRRWKK